MAQVFSLVCWGGANGKSVTVSNTTDLVTLTNHGLRNSTGVAFASGTLPTVTGTPLALNTIYYAKWIAANTFELYREAALTNKIDFTSTGSSLIMKSAYYLGLSDKSRWTTGGVERIYESLAAWISGRAGASRNDTEVAEIGMGFITYQSSALAFGAIPAGATLATTLVDGQRSSGFHNGVVGSGFEVVFTAGYTGINNSNSVNASVDGFTVSTTTTNNTLISQSPGSQARNMLVYGGGTSSNTGIATAHCSMVENCVAFNLNIGFLISSYSLGNSLFSCIATKCAFGIQGDNYSASLRVVANCISIGNTTNWTAQGSVTGLYNCTNNVGGTGEAWVTSGGVRIETTEASPFSAIFSNWTNNVFTAASIFSIQVENGVDYFQRSEIDIRGLVRLAYPGSAFNTAVTAGSFVAGLSYTIASVGTTDFTAIGASANTVGVTFKATGAGSGTGTATLNARIDIGAYEFDLGYGAWPATATISLTNIASGSRVLITKASDGSVLYNDIPGTSLSHTTSHIGDFNVVIRKGTASPFYREFAAAGTTVANQTTSIKCLQQLDE